LDSVSSFETSKLVNWHIIHCGFFKGILQDITKRYSHACPTSSLHLVSALSLRESVRDILDILAQYNRSKPTLACTSSLGFSRLYTHVMVHCNTSFCTTLLYNKDVALKGFFHGYRLTRLNHVSFVFSIFLFYAFPSAFTLAYTIWYNTSRC